MRWQLQPSIALLSVSFGLASAAATAGCASLVGDFSLDRPDGAAGASDVGADDGRASEPAPTGSAPSDATATSDDGASGGDSALSSEAGAPAADAELSPDSSTSCTPTDPRPSEDCLGAKASGLCSATTLCIQYTDGGAYDCAAGGSCSRCYETFTCSCLAASGLIPSGCRCVPAGTGENANDVPIVDCP